MTNVDKQSVQQNAGSPVEIVEEEIVLRGFLKVPKDAKGIVLFAHGSGSSRYSPRNRKVAKNLQKSGLATLLFDLLTEEEAEVDNQKGTYRFDVEMLTDRLILGTDWVLEQERTGDLQIGYFGSSTGSAAALIAAAKQPDVVNAIVSRGGRVDLAETFIEEVDAPTLFLAGEKDKKIIEIHRDILQLFQVESKFEIVKGAGHLFEEPGKLEEVAGLSRKWFLRYLTAYYDMYMD